MKPRFIGYDEERAYLTQWSWGDLPKPTDAALREPVEDYKSHLRDVVDGLMEDYKSHLRDVVDGLMETVALQAATVLFDQIAEDAGFYYRHDSGTIAVLMVEGMYLEVPLRAFLVEQASDWATADDFEDGETTPPQRLAALLREIADEIEGAEERNGNGT